MIRHLLGATALVAWAGTAGADAPRVVTDIAPIHSLVASVMRGTGEPDLILPPGASPHGYAMRPSSARALQRADLVFWVGPELAPWLARPLDVLPDGAEAIALMDLPGVTRLQFREGAELGHAHEDDLHEHDASDHDHDHDHDDHDHADDDHAGDAHGHDDDEGHDHAAEDPHAGHDHDHEGLDPHGWLDPENARTWLSAIAEELAAHDPENAALYQENAREARAALAEQSNGIADRLDAAAPIRFMVFHDGYQYFEHRFGLTSSGAITDVAAASPGAARVSALHDKLEEQGLDCLFTEPQFSAGIADSVAGQSGIRQIELDPLGNTLDPGPDLYPDLIGAMAESFLACKG